MREGTTKRPLHLDLSIENECVDVILAGVRIKVDYDALSKAFFVAVGMPGAGFEFAGREMLIGELYDALYPLTLKD